jgi:hypothetical protein
VHFESLSALNLGVGEPPGGPGGRSFCSDKEKQDLPEPRQILLLVATMPHGAVGMEMAMASLRTKDLRSIRSLVLPVH